MIQKIFISGIANSGKGSIKFLLDSHYSIAVIPMQGFYLDILSEDFIKFIETSSKKISLIEMNRKKTFKKNLYIKINLNNKNYEVKASDVIYYLTNCKSGKTLNENCLSKIIYSGKDKENEEYFEFIFNFEKFLRAIYDNLIILKQINLNELYDLILNSFINNWNNLNTKVENIKYICLTTNNNIDNLNQINQNITNFKSLIISRNFQGLLFTSSLMYLKKNNLDFNTNDSKILSKYNQILFSIQLINKIKLFEIAKKKYKNNNKVKFIDFEKIFNLEYHNQILKFFELSQISEIKATFNKIPLYNSDINFAKKISDDHLKSLHNKQLYFLNFMYTKKIELISFSTIESIYAFIYLYFRYYLKILIKLIVLKK